MQRELGHECHPSNWPWAFGLWLVEGPAGAFELDVQGGRFLHVLCAWRILLWQSISVLFQVP